MILLTRTAKAVLVFVLIVKKFNYRLGIFGLVRGSRTKYYMGIKLKEKNISFSIDKCKFIWYNKSIK